jgi:3-hydroxyacyl-[acyl-carrier-protein] dehydratase
MTAASGAGFRLLRLATAPAAATTAPPAATAQGAATDKAATTARAATAAAVAPVAVAQLLVPAGSPIFAGHFPGQPLLPGVAHLALLRLVLGELAARGELPGDLAGNTAIAEVRKLRLRRPVLPGDRLELRLLSIDAGGVIRFELWRQAPAREAEERARPGESGAPPDEMATPHELASDGMVRIGTCGPPPAGALSPSLDPLPPAGLPSAAGRLPHAPPARLLAALLAAGAGGVIGTGVIPGDHPLAAGGEAPGFLAVELAAQAAAALETLARPPGGGPRLGYLVGVRAAHLPAALPTGRALRITAVPAGGAAALSTYEMEVALQDAGAGRLAAGVISTFLPES